MPGVDITFTVTLDYDKIQNHAPLDRWVEQIRVDHDMFLDGEDVTWNDVYHFMSLAYLSEGHYEEFQTSSTWDISDTPSTPPRAPDQVTQAVTSREHREWISRQE